MKKLLVAVALVTCVAAQAADLLLVNGRVFLPTQNQFAEAIAITGDRITAVGSTKEILAFSSKGMRKIDLRGAFVVPGFNDAHVHFSPLPPGFIINTTPQSTFAQVASALQFATEEAPEDVFIFGTIGPSAFFDPNASRTTLNTASGRRKVMLSEWTGHGAILSTAAVNALDVATPTDRIGGRFERDAQGRLTGRVFEYAQYALERKLADSTSDADNAEALSRLCDQALRYGITTLQIMPTMNAQRFQTLVQQVNSAVRIRIMRLPMTNADSLNTGDNAGANIGAVKWILDGTPIEQGAALRTNYPGTGLSGVENFTATQLRTMLNDALVRHEQPLLHAAGDRTIATILKVMKSMDTAQNWTPRRLRIEHGDGMQGDLIPDARAFGVVVVQNPTHLPARTFYPAGEYMLLKSLLAKGIKLAIGSDGPLDPYLNLQLAVTHPVVPEEKLSLFQALTAYTAGSAYAEKVDDKGQIAAGQLADLAVLSRDLFTLTPQQFAGTESIMTIVGGKIVFDAGVLH